MSNKDLIVPESSAGDKVHSLTKAGLSAIPILGGPAAELFQSIIQPPLEKRRLEWMDRVGKKLQSLEQSGVNLENLKENDEFISAVMSASQIALRTHKEEKLDSLRNAVANIAKGQAPEETIQQIFFNFIDTFTELHVQILKVFKSPSLPPNLFMGGLSDVLIHNIPRLNGQRILYDQIWKDLYSKGLVFPDSLHITSSHSDLASKHTTSLGDEFLQFMSDPE